MQAPSLIEHGVVPSDGGGAGFGFGLVVVGFGVVFEVLVAAGAGAGGGAGGVVVVGSTVVVVVVGAGLGGALFTLGPLAADAPLPHADSNSALPATVTPTISFLTRITAPIARSPMSLLRKDDVGDRIRLLVHVIRQ
jgi:hypothetical protein